MDTRATTSAHQNSAAIIGGMFGLEDAAIAGATQPDFLAAPHLAMVNARSALRLTIERLQPRQTWFPSYFCDSMLAAVEALPTQLQLFGIDDSLQIETPAWIDDLQPGDVVVLIEYFGFPCDEVWIERIHQRRGVVIIDAAQSLLTDHSSTRADMIVYSPRKFVGVPDGGLLELRSHFDLAQVPLAAAPTDWFALAMQATTGRRDFDRTGGDRAWFTQFQSAEASQPVGDFAMSSLSSELLSKLDYAAIASRRRANYLALLDELRPLAIFPQLPANVTPIGFPIRLAERDRVRQALYAQQIYPPVHWPVAPIVPAEFTASYRLAAAELTLPCDQRYAVTDMQRMARIVLQEAGT